MVSNLEVRDGRNVIAVPERQLRNIYTWFLGWYISEAKVSYLWG